MRARPEPTGSRIGSCRRGAPPTSTVHDRGRRPRVDRKGRIATSTIHERPGHPHVDRRGQSAQRGRSLRTGSAWPSPTSTRREVLPPPGRSISSRRNPRAVVVSKYAYPPSPSSPYPNRLGSAQTRRTHLHTILHGVDDDAKVAEPVPPFLDPLLVDAWVRVAVGAALPGVRRAKRQAPAMCGGLPAVGQPRDRRPPVLKDPPAGMRPQGDIASESLVEAGTRMPT